MTNLADLEAEINETIPEDKKQVFIPKEKKAKKPKLTASDLIVFDTKNAMQVLTSDEGVEQLLTTIREKVETLDGGDIKTATGRKSIRSNAFLATKSKKPLNEHIDKLIKATEDKIAPELETIALLKENKKTLSTGIDQIRKDVGAVVDEYEAELEAKKAAKAEEKRLKDWDIAIAQYEEHKEKSKVYAHMEAIIDNMQFDTDRAAKAKAHEKEVAANNKRIIEEANKQAIIDAENIRAENERIQKAQEQQIKQNAIDLENANKRAEAAAEQHRLDEIERARQKEINDKRQAQAIEDARLQAEQQEKQRVAAELAKVEAEKAARMANAQHRANICGDIKAHLINKFNLPAVVATNIVIDMRDEKMPHTEVKF